ncbi:MarR family transcriptional regulator [Paenibacillus dokdonensis]|uniref:MarR family transcriptional regulator n=1 Tax=Paenibacillus dokdonensis TaxID=2567944 RepID=UPI0010A79B23
MILLWNHKGLSQIDILGTLLIEHSVLSGLLQRMRKAGFIRNSPDHHDGRVMRI